MNNSPELLNDSSEDAELAYQKQMATRKANIEQIDRESHRESRFARVISAAFGFLLLILITAAIARATPIIIASACGFILAVALLMRATQRINRLKKLRREICKAEEYSQKVRREREGLTHARQESDIVVHGREWDATNHVRTEWVEGETKRLLPGDVVVKWHRYSDGGLYIERNGKIIAKRTLMHIDW